MPHVKQYARFVKNSLAGDEAALEHFRDFYDEYFAVLDMSADFYLETLKRVFFEHHIGTGQMQFRGEKVDFASIKNMPLLTVEGANDHLCPPGQTEAAHGVFAGIPKSQRAHYIQPDVGHYGVFSGSKFRSGIYPVIRDFAQKASGAGKVKAKAN
jgi:poly(3-hydroxybutyrate) depolymerase